MTHPDQQLAALTALQADGTLERALTPTWTWLVPLPPQGTGANARLHWAKKQRITREYRDECAAVYLTQPHPSAPLERVHVDVEMRVCRKRHSAARVEAGYWPVDEYRAWLDAEDRYRPRDEGNVLDACKAALDALQPDTPRGVGAGVVVGDDSKHMTLGAPSIVEVPDWSEEGVFIRLEELRASA